MDKKRGRGGYDKSGGRGSSYSKSSGGRGSYNKSVGGRGGYSDRGKSTDDKFKSGSYRAPSRGVPPQRSRSLHQNNEEWSKSRKEDRENKLVESRNDETYSITFGIKLPVEDKASEILNIFETMGIEVISTKDNRLSGGYFEFQLNKESANHFISEYLKAPTFPLKLIREVVPRTHGYKAFDEYVKSSYDSQLNGLRFSMLNLRIDKPITWSYHADVDNLLKKANELYPHVAGIDFSSNAIKNLKLFEGLKNFKSLTQLCFDNNDISDLNELPKLPNITVVSFIGNPVETKHNYFDMVHTKFPNLKKLDGNDAQIFKFMEAIERIPFPSRDPVSVHYCESQEHQNISEDFLYRFFNSYDSSRRNVVNDFYKDTAIFSLTVTQDLLEQYRQYSCNTWKGIERMIVGKEKISSCFASLPETKHDFLAIVYDSFSLPFTLHNDTIAVIELSISGHCQEVRSSRLLKFSRVLIIEVSKNNPSDVRIVNDMLNLSTLNSIRSN